MNEADFWFLVCMGVVGVLFLISVGVFIGYMIGRNTSDVETMAELRMLRMLNDAKR